jgi:hypothetical protein
LQTLIKQGSCPKPLREHLAMNFPSSVPIQSTSKRPTYHARLIASAPSLSHIPVSPDINNLDIQRQSFRKSQVRVSSPLCHQVDEDPISEKAVKKPSWIVGPNGLLSPPASPDESCVTTMFNRQRPMSRSSWADSPSASVPRQDLPRPASLASTASSSLRPGPNRPTMPTRPSGLWTDSIPIPAPQPDAITPNLASDAPKFSRSSMRKSGIVMPASAPRSNSSSSLRSRLTRNPSNNSLSSLTPSSSSQSLQTLRRPTLTPKSSQDRLSTLMATTQRDAGVDEHGIMALDSLAPPRPSFMKRSNSSSSVSSDASGRSMSSMTSLTSASSACMSSLDSCNPIQEEDDKIHIHLPDLHLPPTCTKSDADAASQSSAEKKPKRGGLFKRLSRALKMEKKVTIGDESVRRGSL